MLRVVDGDNYFRRMITSDPSGNVLRNLIDEVVYSNSVEVWIWDGFNARQKRASVFPDYKAKRVKASEDIYATRDLFQEALLHTKAISIRVNGWEADDVIATMVQQFGAGEQIKIQSNDKDLLQLESPTVKVMRDPIPGVHASEVRLWKTLTGDSSDNISGIPGFGPKSWDSCNKEAFADLLENRRSWPSLADQAMEDFMVKKASANWLVDNEKQLRIMYEIIGLYSVPWDDVENNMIQGVPNKMAVEEVFARFMQ